MRVDVTPRQATLQPGVPAPITVTIANTEAIIAGFTIRVLGADPGWVELDTDDIALFPDESRTIPVLVTPPKGIAAGSRRIAVQIRELTPPYASTIAEIDLTVPPAPGMQLRADPLSITAGKRANYGLLVENTGNTNIKGLLAGGDPENKVRFEFEPERVTLSPGQHAVVDMQAGAKRHFLGTPTVRRLSVYFDEVSGDAFFEEPEQTARPDGAAATEEERKPLAVVTFVQRSVMSRGALSLLGLLFAATVFAVVITIALSKLVAQTTADRDLALEVAAARNAASGTGQSGVSGTVTLLTTRKPAAGVAVSVFSATNASTAIATTATNAAGSYTVSDLPAGQYKISFRGAGFVQVWYPGAADDSDATTITLSTGQVRGGLDVSLGGVPATITGTVTGSDVSASTLYLETVPQGATTASARTAALGQAPTPVTPPDNGAAVVEQVPIGSDGSFTLNNVPSPSVYQLILVKPGFATSSQRIDVSAGENRTGVQLTLNKGDGLIEGVITSQSGPLSGVTVSATTGQQSTNTVSLTGAGAGTFTLRNLPTPATFTIVASRSGYAPQTLSLNLAAGQKLTGVAITLSRTSASLHGVVLLLPKNTSAPGVEVTVSDGQTTVQTATESTKKGAGTWSVGGLPIPGTYTVTFARSDLESQTVSVTLDAAGNPVPGPAGSQITAAGITVSMQLATATLSGEIRQPGGATVCNAATGAIGEASVTLSSGSASFSVTTASVGKFCGQYRVEQLPPGTYTMTVTAGTGTIPNSQVVILAAGQSLTKNVPLPRPASMSGVVRCCTAGSTGKPGTRSGWTVFIYEQSQFPTSVLAETVTDSQGRFSFANLLSGTYIVAAGPTADPSDVLDTVQVNVQPSQHRTGVTIVVSR